MRAIAIDDEPIALSIIQEFCQRLGDIRLQTFSNAAEGMAAIAGELPDVAFLDIRMGSTDGVQLARQLPAQTSLVFTTAYTEYALAGFELDAVDYLHKPFSFERFCRAVEKVRQHHSAALGKETITLKSAYKNVVVSLTDILYIETMDNYVRLHLADGSHVMSQLTLTSLMELLPAGQFVRIHKSFVVARRHVERNTRHQVFIRQTPHPLPIGRTYAAATASFAAD